VLSAHKMGELNRAWRGSLGGDARRETAGIVSGQLLYRLGGRLSGAASRYSLAHRYRTGGGGRVKWRCVTAEFP
jgi:hypothetical protein